MYLSRGLLKLKHANCLLFKSEVRVSCNLQKFLKIHNDTTKNTPATFAENLVDSVPKNLQPYLKLSRLDKPIGSWLLFWPCSWGIAAAAPACCFPDPTMLLLFGTGSLIMRGAGCTINDMFDRDIDAKVERSANRPLVNGDLNMRQAWMYLGVQLSAGLLVLCQLNYYSIILGASSLALVCSYPLMKRFTNYPQVVLGFTFNWGVLIGYSAIKGYVDYSILPMYFAAMFWTIIYDTIYAHQDRKDDVRLGIKSTAIHFGGDTKKYLTGFTTAMLSFMTLSGVLCEQTWPFYTSVAVAGAHVFAQIVTMNIDSPESCKQRFISNSQVGLIMFLGITFGTLFKSNVDADKKQNVVL